MGMFYEKQEFSVLLSVIPKWIDSIVTVYNEILLAAAAEMQRLLFSWHICITSKKSKFAIEKIQVLRRLLMI